MNRKCSEMATWFYYAIGAGVLYGLHQVFTKLAAERISDGLGGFVVETTAALTILGYLAAVRLSGNWNQSWTWPRGLVFRDHRDLCWGGHRCLLFVIPKGRPLSAGPVGLLTYCL